MNSADRFWAYFDTWVESEKPLTDALSAEFGIPFRVVHTGGNCWAIEAAPFEGGYGVLITDAEDILTKRSERTAGDGMGYAVGVYPMESQEYKGETIQVMGDDVVGWASSTEAHSPADVILLVKAALLTAAQSKKGVQK